MSKIEYRTPGGATVICEVESTPYSEALNDAFDAIDHNQGALFCSGYEYPGRYSRWDIGFIRPPLEIIGRHRKFEINALNERGKCILPMIQQAIEGQDYIESMNAGSESITGELVPMPEYFPEEERSKQPGLFSMLRSIRSFFGSDQDPYIGFFGSFGYDLVFQFEPIDLRHERPDNYADAHLFLPDQLFIVDHRKETAEVRNYDFHMGTQNTQGLERTGKHFPLPERQSKEIESDNDPGEYAEKVDKIIEGTKKGDFFEVVLSQVFTSGCLDTPRELFDKIRKVNPSPYEFLINLGNEQLVGASPEMFVRVRGSRVETCPISGTVPRGNDAIEDAERILELMTSKKDEAELTMCTDVDRNDKSRVCKPGSVQVVGRRLIEAYSRLFHTVDHVDGELLDDYDAFDALLSHMWACTLTGAPKPAAMQMIEDLENSPREWYGGAVGFIGFNGDMNTGITIRTIHLKDGLAKFRVGATLLCDSGPEAEERECRTKAAAFLDVLAGKTRTKDLGFQVPHRDGFRPRVFFVDNQDSFVHTLANYFRQAQAEVITIRAGFPLEKIDEFNPDLVFISPGPGTPEEFNVPTVVQYCIDKGIPCFGVCLGLQGMVQAFGGELKLLDYPMHGKPSDVTNRQSGVFDGFPESFRAGRYHSIYADRDALPDCLEVTAETEDGTIMAIQHKELPYAAVQFHPESILTLRGHLGLKLIHNVLSSLK
ncbi:MAG: anthranilate synthase component I [Opitutales bacterium]|jgi:anthranilate synthase|nr:anthranilate synthase component I [Opitutales bacterium]